MNPYVGGDAYNLIIDGEKAIANFVVVLIFTMIGCVDYLIGKFAHKERKRN